MNSTGTDPSGTEAAALADEASGFETPEAGLLPVADTNYEYAFPYAHFVGATESVDLALEAAEAFDAVEPDATVAADATAERKLG